MPVLENVLITWWFGSKMPVLENFVITWWFGSKMPVLENVVIAWDFGSKMPVLEHSSINIDLFMQAGIHLLTMFVHINNQIWHNFKIKRWYCHRKNITPRHTEFDSSYKKIFLNGFYERISLEDFYSCTVRNQEIFFHTFEPKNYN